jgi:hypothetical protein
MIRTYAAILSRSSEGKEGLGAFEDELPLEFLPGKSLVNTLAFHNQVSHPTQGNVMLLGTGLWAGGPLHRAPVAYLTALQAQLALRYPDDLFDSPGLTDKAAAPRGPSGSAGWSHSTLRRYFTTRTLSSPSRTPPP